MFLAPSWKMTWDQYHRWAFWSWRVQGFPLVRRREHLSPFPAHRRGNPRTGARQWSCAAL